MAMRRYIIPATLVEAVSATAVLVSPAGPAATAVAPAVPTGTTAPAALNRLRITKRALGPRVRTSFTFDLL